MRLLYSIVRCSILSVLPFLLWTIIVTSEASATILNPSFESSPDGFGLTDWDFTSAGSLSGDQDGEFVTHGQWNARIYSRCFAGMQCPSFSAGDFGSFTQVVDLSEVHGLLMDLETRQGGGAGIGSWDGRFEASVLIDSAQIWASTTPGSFLALSFDTSSLSGMHLLEFRVEALLDIDIGDGSNHFNFDNLRTIPIPEPTTGTLTALALCALAFIRRVGIAPPSNNHLEGFVA